MKLPLGHSVLRRSVVAPVRRAPLCVPRRLFGRAEFSYNSGMNWIQSPKRVATLTSNDLIADPVALNRNGSRDSTSDECATAGHRGRPSDVSAPYGSRLFREPARERTASAHLERPPHQQPRQSDGDRGPSGPTPTASNHLQRACLSETRSSRSFSSPRTRTFPRSSMSECSAETRPFFLFRRFATEIQGLSHAGVEPLYSAATRFARADFNVQTNNGFR